MKTFALSTLYVCSIVLAVGIGLFCSSAGSRADMVSEGALPCTSNINTSGGSCPQKSTTTLPCNETYYTVGTAPPKNGRADTSGGQFDDCNGASTACQYYYQYPLVSCTAE